MLCSQMSLVFSCHVLMDAHLSIDFEGALCSKLRATSRMFRGWQCHGVGINQLWW